MFKSTKLSKILITGSKEKLEDAVSLVHNKGVVHIKDFTEEKGGFKIGEAMPDASDISKKLITVKSIGSCLALDRFIPEKKEKISVVENWLTAKLGELEAQVSEISKAKETHQAKFDELEQNQNLLDKLSGLPADLRLDVSGVSVFAGYLKRSPANVLGDMKKSCKVYESSEKKRWLVVIHCPENTTGRIEELLELADFEAMELPQVTGTIGSSGKVIETELSTAKKELAKVEVQISELRQKNGNVLYAAEEYLTNKLDVAEAPLHIATTQEFFMIEGWLPDKKYDGLKGALEKELAGYVSIEKIEDDDETPVLMKNSKAARPFEPLVDAFATPKSREIDPTTLVAIVFPIFFGMMLGDIGYGIVILSLIGTGTTKKMFRVFSMDSVTPQLNKILMFSAIASIIFGILYGEFFGFLMYTSEAHTGFLFPDIQYGQYEFIPLLFGMKMTLPIDRFAKEGIQILIVFSAMIGIVHLYLAWFLGFRNVAIFHGVKEAFMEKGSWLITLTGGWMLSIWILPLMMKGQPMDFMTPVPIISLALLIGGLLLAVKAEGFTALVEVPTMLLSNTLSYTRLFAVGASSAGIALAFNTIATKQINPELTTVTAISWVLAGLILFMGHFINVLLGLLGPTLHSLRLHYVEFFIKFYEGGGNRYKPFGKSRRYTIEQ